METLHTILKYLEVYTDLNAVDIPTMTFKLRTGIDIEKMTMLKMVLILVLVFMKY